MSFNVGDAEAASLRQRFDGTITIKTCTAAAANSFTALVPGRYRIVSKGDGVYVLQTTNAAATAASATTASWLPEGVVDYFEVNETANGGRVSVISDVSSASVFITLQR